MSWMSRVGVDHVEPWKPRALLHTKLRDAFAAQQGFVDLVDPAQKACLAARVECESNGRWLGQHQRSRCDIDGNGQRCASYRVNHPFMLRRRKRDRQQPGFQCVLLENIAEALR